MVYHDPRVGKWGLKNILRKLSHHPTPSHLFAHLENRHTITTRPNHIYHRHDIPVCFGGDVFEVVSPYRPGTTAGRLLDKLGRDGGYMIIMNTANAAIRRDYILHNKLAKTIVDVTTKEATMVQYHHKGIKGGVMPELDSHIASEQYPTPVLMEFSPWGALGPASREPFYIANMKYASYLRLAGVVLRLAESDQDTEGAARQWEETFGVPRVRDLLYFFNGAKMGFVAGLRGEKEGIHSITLEVEGKWRLERMLWAAREEGICGDGYVTMVGIRWYFIQGSD